MTSLRCTADGREVEIGPGADLQGVNWSNAVLKKIDLRGADLRNAILTNAILNKGDLCEANLEGANLEGACLQSVDLCSANMKGANLNHADLRGAYLSAADLSNAKLEHARFQGAIINHLILRNTDLCSATGFPIAKDYKARLLDVWDHIDRQELDASIGDIAIDLAGEPGRIMETTLGPEVTTLLLLGVDGHRILYSSGINGLSSDDKKKTKRLLKKIVKKLTR